MLAEQTGLCWFCGWVRPLLVFVGISAADGHLRTVISGQGIIPKHTVTVSRTGSGLGIRIHIFPPRPKCLKEVFRTAD